MKKIIVIFSSLFLFFSFSVFVLAAPEDTYPDDGITDDFSLTLNPYSNLGSGNIVAVVPRVHSVVSYTLDSITDSDGISIGGSIGPGSVTIPISVSDAFFHFSGSVDVPLHFRFSFPNSMRNQHLTGFISIPLIFDSGANWVTFYDGNTVWASANSFRQFDARYSLEVLSDSTDSLMVNLHRSASSDQYYFNIYFQDFYLTGTTDNTAKLSFDLLYHFNFTMTSVFNTYTGSSNSLTLPNECILDINTSTISAGAIARINGPGFHTSNDYYTIINALQNSERLSSMDQSLYDISNFLSDTYDLLESWNTMQSNVFQDFFTVDFPAFSNALLSAIGRISGGSSTDYSSQLSSIITLLGALNSKCGTMEQWLSSIYSLIDHLSDTSEEISSHSASIEANTEWLLEIYNMIDGITVYPPNPDSEDPGHDDYLELYSQPLIGLIYALACGFTGDNLGEGDLFPDSLSENTFDRWVDIISTALIGAFDGFVPAGSDDLSEDIEVINQYETDFHTYEESLWTRVRTLLIDSDLFDRYSTAPSSVVSAGDWFVTSINYVFGSLGIFTFVISTVLLSGVFVVILGRIRQFT